MVTITRLDSDDDEDNNKKNVTTDKSASSKDASKKLEKNVGIHNEDIDFDEGALYTMKSIFLEKETYKYLYKKEFLKNHKHNFNIVFHIIFMSLQTWAMTQLLISCHLSVVVYLLGAIIALSTPNKVTCVLHILLMAFSIKVPCLALYNLVMDNFQLLFRMFFMPVVLPLSVNIYLSSIMEQTIRYFFDNQRPVYFTLVLYGSGVLKDIGHYLCDEKLNHEKYTQNNNKYKPIRLFLFISWHVSMIIDSVLNEYCYIPALLINRNKIFYTSMNTTNTNDKEQNKTSTTAKQVLNTLLVRYNKSIASQNSNNETESPFESTTSNTSNKEVQILSSSSTNKKITSRSVPLSSLLTNKTETDTLNDSIISHGLRKYIFSRVEHFDISSISQMNQIVIDTIATSDENTKEEPKEEKDSFFTTNGPFWFFPYVSLYRVIIPLTTSNPAAKTPNSELSLNVHFPLLHDDDDEEEDNVESESQKENKCEGDERGPNIKQSKKILSLKRFDVIGYDYNRELHKIDYFDNNNNSDNNKQDNNDYVHVNKIETEEDNTDNNNTLQQISYIKLHYIVYPKGWHKYGNFCSKVNIQYDNNNHDTNELSWHYYFHNTILYPFIETYLGWNNIFYVAVICVIFGRNISLSETITGTTNNILFFTFISFRHYIANITTIITKFIRDKEKENNSDNTNNHTNNDGNIDNYKYYNHTISYGHWKRDFNFFEMMAILQFLLYSLHPIIQLPKDIPGIMSIVFCSVGTRMLLLIQQNNEKNTKMFGSVKQRNTNNKKDINKNMIFIFVTQLLTVLGMIIWFQDRLFIFTRSFKKNFILIQAHMVFTLLHISVKGIFLSANNNKNENNKKEKPETDKKSD